jgi:SAM-dependent methyltransferase
MSAEFDGYQADYDELVERSISFAGRGHDFYLEAKARALLGLARRRLGDPAELAALDVGCGAGLMHPFLTAIPRLHGVDVSPAQVEAARAAHPQVEYAVASGTRLPYGDGSFDLAFAVCVVHHVPVEERAAFAAELRRVTRPGGLVVVFEHNPLNPLTRLAVSRCEFDEDAVLLRRGETARRLRIAGAEPVESRFILFTPWRLPAVERALRAVPLGAQYYVAARAAGSA